MKGRNKNIIIKLSNYSDVTQFHARIQLTKCIKGFVKYIQLEESTIYVESYSNYLSCVLTTWSFTEIYINKYVKFIIYMEIDRCVSAKFLLFIIQL